MDYEEYAAAVNAVVGEITLTDGAGCVWSPIVARPAGFAVPMSQMPLGYYLILGATLSLPDKGSPNNFHTTLDILADANGRFVHDRN